MARQTQRRKTARQGVDVSSTPVQLQTNRRFFAAGGYDRNVRAARALQNAFNAGAEAVTDYKFDQNQKGARQALAERGQGNLARDEDNAQAGYNRAWDALDAEFDANQAAAELPEILRGADWENLPEEKVQEIINEHLQERFKGIEQLADSAYAQTLAPKMLQLETDLIGKHRQMQIVKIKEEQRTKIMANIEADLDADRGLDPDAPLDYQKLFDQTGTFFDGAEKKEAFWQMLYDLAINRGEPEMIEQVPVIMNGVPSGIKDSKLLAQHRTAIAAATRQGARMLADREAAQKEMYRDQLFELQLAIAEKKIAGLDYSAELVALKDNPEASFSDFSSAISHGRSQLNENDARSQNVPYTAQLWNAVYSRDATLSDVLRAHEEGYLGTGKQSNATLSDMMATIRQIREGARRGNSAVVTTYRSEVAKRYNPIMNAMGGVDPKMQHIQFQAGAMYNDLVIQQGMDPAGATEQIYAKFDEMVAKTGAATFSDSQNAFTLKHELVKTEDLKSLAAGRGSYRDVFASLRPHEIEERLHAAIMANELTKDEVNAILLQNQ
ncbi:hypothetical protein [Microbulbifer discodermiae]|uniref:hypothetical protein n=1 Tax=Microbulbifer sp. 2201CG32-9 TaxID=3232309 RepID=UPI00345C0072